MLYYTTLYYTIILYNAIMYHDIIDILYYTVLKYWVAVKELKLSYHNGCIYIYIYYITGFPQYSNLL